MSTTSVYIVITNRGDRLKVHASLYEWDPVKIVGIADVEEVEITGIEEPTPAEYREWVTIVVRRGSRALEDALMQRVYRGTAGEPVQFMEVEDYVGDVPGQEE